MPMRQHSPAALFLLLYPALAAAQVRTDGSVGAAVTLAGPNYAIQESLGRRAGNNLFHSFQVFKVRTGETAVFSTVTPTLANVFARVTGGEVSSIDGTIRLQAAAGAPALFLVNPAGVTFGPNSEIDVPGAFHVSTADAVKFPDGNFHADPARASTFSAAPPEAFGFLGERRATVALEGAGLSTGDSRFGVAAGDIALSRAAFVQNRGGAVTAIAVGGQASVVPLTGAPGPLQGEIRLGPGSYLGTYSANAAPLGDVRLEAGRIEAHGTGELFTGAISMAAGSGAGGRVSVRADDVLVLKAGARVLTATLGVPEAGAVSVRAGRFTAEGAGGSSVSAVMSVSAGTGRTGNVSVHVAGELALHQAAEVSTSAIGDDSAAGDVEVRAGRLRLLGAGDFSTSIGSFASGRGSHGGNVTVAVTGAATLQGTGHITSYSDSASTGAVRLSANSIVLDGLFTGVASSADGVSGGVTVEAADSIRILDRADVRSSSHGKRQSGDARLSARTVSIEGGRVETQGDAGGNIAVRATESLVVSAGGELNSQSGGGIRVETPDLLLDGGNIRSSYYGDTGSSGDIRVAAQRIRLVKGGEIQSWNVKAGNGGAVSIESGELLLDDSTISAKASAGRGGDVSVSVAGTATLRNGSNIASENGAGESSSTGNVTLGARELLLQESVIESANAYSAGRAGDITVTVSERLEITGDTRSAGIRSDHWGSGDRAGAAGHIRVRAGTLLMDGGKSQVGTGLATSTNDGTAGAMDVEVGGDATLRGAYVTSTSSGAGDGGPIRWRVGGALSMENSSITASGFGEGRAGSISIDARALTMRSTPETTELGFPLYSDIASNGYGRGAGSVTLRVRDDVVLSGRSDISTNTFGSGNAGRIRVDAGSLTLAGGEHNVISSTTASTGNAGEIVIAVRGAMELRRGAEVTTTTLDSGRAGVISIAAGSLRVDGRGRSADPARITSRSALEADARGDAGSISLRVAGPLEVVHGGEISSAAGRGAAGEVAVQAGSVLVEGMSPDGATPSRIGARTFSQSSGQAGNVTILASDRIVVADGAEISVENDARGAQGVAGEGLLRLQAPDVLVRGATVTAGSTGNVAASDIVVEGGRMVWIERGRITTSATGEAGGGGNIRVATPVLVLNTGFVQANATAPGATGGNIALEADALLPSHDSLRVGGDTPLVFRARVAGLNAVQAAAPTGVSGTIEIASPQVDVTRSLVALDANVLPPQALGRSACAGGAGSSLALVGRGGLPPAVIAPAASWAAQQARAQVASPGAILEPVTEAAPGAAPYSQLLLASVPVCPVRARR